MKKSSIIIIEDDQWLAEQYERMLARFDYKITIALNALDAIQMIDRSIPDIIMLDVLLPGSTAFALLHELQSYEDTSKIPVILCTNLANEMLLEDLKPYGVVQILDKTKMEPGDLVTAVKNIIP